MDPEIMSMSSDDIRQRTRMIENDVRIMRSEIQRGTGAQREYPSIATRRRKARFFFFTRGLETPDSGRLRRSFSRERERERERLRLCVGQERCSHYLGVLDFFVFCFFGRDSRFFCFVFLTRLCAQADQARG